MPAIRPRALSTTQRDVVNDTARYRTSPLAKPLGAPTTLRIAAVEDLVPAGEPRIVDIGETFGDDALAVGVDRRPVRRPLRA